MRNLSCSLLLLFVALVFSGCGGPASIPSQASLDQPLPAYEPRQTNLTPEQKYLEQVLEKKGYTNGSKPTVIVVHKLARKLTLYRGLTPLKTYKIVLGNDPYNDKLRQGDTCTPEGVYRVVCKYPHPKWDYFILLDYPNTQNWLKFGRAKKAGKVPLDADIGGSIGIHGTEYPWRNLSGTNWTKGCVSLLNRDLEEIYPLINDKTLVVINRD
jgi:murein L,D-transpeptidase YafK